MFIIYSTLEYSDMLSALYENYSCKLRGTRLYLEKLPEKNQL